MRTLEQLETAAHDADQESGCGPCGMLAGVVKELIGHIRTKGDAREQSLEERLRMALERAERAERAHAATLETLELDSGTNFEEELAYLRGDGPEPMSPRQWRVRAETAEAELAKVRETLAEVRRGSTARKVAELEGELATAQETIVTLREDLSEAQSRLDAIGKVLTGDGLVVPVAPDSVADDDEPSAGDIVVVELPPP